MRMRLSVTMLLAAMILAGCNTWRALGQDVKEVGGAVGETAGKVGPKIGETAEKVGQAIGRGVERVGQSIQGAADSPREEVDRPRQ